MAKAAEDPIAVDERIDQGSAFGGSGLVVVVVFAGEGLEGGGVFAGDDFGFGEDAGLQGVGGGALFAFGRDGPGGELRICGDSRRFA